MPDPSVPNPLPVTIRTYRPADQAQVRKLYLEGLVGGKIADRKSTRLNSSHEWSSYAVFCLKKKNDGVRHLGPHGERPRTPPQDGRVPSARAHGVQGSRAPHGAGDRARARSPLVLARRLHVP